MTEQPHLRSLRRIGHTHWHANSRTLCVAVSIQMLRGCRTHRDPEAACSDDRGVGQPTRAAKLFGLPCRRDILLDWLQARPRPSSLPEWWRIFLVSALLALRHPKPRRVRPPPPRCQNRPPSKENSESNAPKTTRPLQTKAQQRVSHGAKRDARGYYVRPTLQVKKH